MSCFGVSNGVRQGGVLYPLPFAAYIDELLVTLERLRTGCYIYFVGALCYADDIVLLAPSPSALHILLSECECFSRDSELNFNASKTQLICFHLKKNLMVCSVFFGHIPSVIVYTILVMSCLSNLKIPKTSIVYLWA